MSTNRSNSGRSPSNGRRLTSPGNDERRYDERGNQLGTTVRGKAGNKVVEKTYWNHDPHPLTTPELTTPSTAARRRAGSDRRAPRHDHQGAGVPAR